MGVAEIVTITARPLTPEAWSPFGWLPVADSDPRDGIHGLSFGWADVHLNYREHAPGEVRYTGAGPLVERLYRHDAHTQALMPVNCDAVMAVAPETDGRFFKVPKVIER